MNYAVFGLGLALACATGTAGFARPLLNSSEESLASVCIEYDDTPARLIEICTLALDEPGATEQQRAEMLESLGYAYFDEGDHARARDVFDDMLSRDGDDVRALVGLGWVAHGQDDFATARDLFRKAARIAPSEASVAGLADSLWELGEAELDEVLLQLDAALAIDPEYGWARRQKGWIQIDGGRFEEAEAQFRDVLNDRPGDVNARAGLLRALIRQARYEDALEQANRVLDEDPDSYWFLSQRSFVLFMLDRERQAIRDAERMIEIDGQDPEGYVRKARAMSYLGQRADALAMLAETEAALGASPALTYWQASLLLDDRAHDAALEMIRRNIDGETPDFYDYRLLTRIQTGRGAYDAAAEAVREALALRGDDAYAIYYDAILMLRREMGVADAMRRFDEAMQAGLPEDEIGDFAGELYDAGFIAHAIAIRAKYAE